MYYGITTTLPSIALVFHQQKELQELSRHPLASSTPVSQPQGAEQAPGVSAVLQKQPLAKRKRGAEQAPGVTQPLPLPKRKRVVSNSTTE